MRLAICLGLLAAAGAAQADTVHLTFVGTAEGRNVSVQFKSTPSSVGYTTLNVFAGQLKHSFSNGTGVAAGLSGVMKTFCTDLSQYVSPNPGSVYTVTPVQNLPISNGAWPAMGSDSAEAIYSLYHSAAGNQFGTNKDLAAAFQIAIWELVYDGPSGFDLATGNVKFTALSAGIQSQVASIANNLQGNFWNPGIMGLAQDGKQDQLVQLPIPLPGPAMLAGVGLIAVGARRRRIA